MEFDFAVEHLDGHARVSVRGDIDVATAPAVRGCLLELADAGYAELVIDAVALEFVDSSGLAALIAAHKRVADDGGRLRVVNTSAALYKVFEISGLTRMLNVEPA